MHVVTEYPDGVFSWVDLASSDTGAAKAFYTALFGWEAEDTATDIGTIYTMFKLGGKNVAGMSGLSPDMQAQGIPTHWSSYVKHSDVDAVAARVTGAGGNVLSLPFDVMQEGRMAMFQDPTGATLGVWQPKNHIGAEYVNVHNALVWNELQTRDTEAARAFFKSVFGWTYTADENGYVTISQDGRRHAGMIQMDDSWGDVPPNWGIYFMVEDVETAVANAQELGGNTLVPPTPAGDIGKFSVVQDPTGGIFSVMEFNGPVDPPPGA